MVPCGITRPNPCHSVLIMLSRHQSPLAAISARTEFPALTSAHIAAMQWLKLPIFGSCAMPSLDPARNGPKMAGFATGSVRQREGAA